MALNNYVEGGCIYPACIYILVYVQRDGGRGDERCCICLLFAWSSVVLPPLVLYSSKVGIFPLLIPTDNT